MRSEGPALTRRRVAAGAVAAVLAVVATTCGGTRPASTATRPTPPAAVDAPGRGAAPILQPGAPGQETRAISTAAAVDLSRVGFTPADVQFMQGMIGHHAQAVEMVALLKARTQWSDMQLLGQRIEASQTDEMNMMRDWLQARGQSVPDAHAHHMHDAHLMPGMLTPAQMEALAAATGRAFDRLFLEGMIRHHQGALTMVKELLAAPGAAQDSEIFSFASDVEADQQMEIDRMGAMLNSLGELSR